MEPPSEIVAALRQCGLLAPGESPSGQELTGGVSSDIWLIALRGGPICVKRALPKLKVAADWRVPVGRNAFEVAWMQVAGRLVPEAVPKVLCHDVAAGMFAMEYLDSAAFCLWKSELRDGRVDLDVAREVGCRLVRIHAGTARDPAIPAQFPTDAIFHAIRLEPYLEEAARAHPDLAPALHGLVRTTAESKRALVHGDVSPKNILVGPRGPVFLDAECAWYGDPAFDLAFCLNHLLLKCLWVPAARNRLLLGFDALLAAYAEGIDWEPRAELLRRAGRLLPGLFLGRIDGKSPVDYLTVEADKNRVRRVARRLLLTPPEDPGTVRQIWATELGT
ncbi:MAG: aminoglycoside phosphotransferase family protein [Lacunisphaera sp.]|nr:aminoglycoside phosphotransferase family protein [Lacunisphaera sp.]